MKPGKLMVDAHFERTRLMSIKGTPLVAQEVWSAEPGIHIYGVGGFRHDDTVIVGARI